MANPLWGPLNAAYFTLDPTVANADEQAWLDQNRNPQPIDPLNENKFDPNEYGLQTVKNDQTFQPDPGMTLQEMLAQRDLQSAAQPSLSQADSPLSFQYQNEEYPNRYGKSELYRDREGPFSDKRQVADPNAYYEHVRSLGTEGDPFMGARDDVDAPFAKQSGDYYAGDYVNYDETTDRPYQGDWSWQEGYNPDDLKGLREYNPMLMEALIRQKQNNLHGVPQNLGFKEESETISAPLDMERFAGVSELGRNDADVEQVDYLGNPTKFQNFKSKMGEGINSLKNKALSGWDSVSGGLNSLMDNTMLGRIGAMRNATNPRAGNYNPALQGQIDFMKEQGAYGNDWDQSGLNKITGGRLAGKNLQSLIGSNDLMDMYGNDLARLEKTLANLPKQWSRLRKNKPGDYKKKEDEFRARIKQNKWEQAQATKDLATRNRIKLGSNLYQDKNYRSDPALSKIGREKYTGKGQAFEQKKSGTFTTPSGKRGYSGGRRDGGRVGYGNGGLATLFTRRG